MTIIELADWQVKLTRRQRDNAKAAAERARDACRKAEDAHRAAEWAYHAAQEARREADADYDSAQNSYTTALAMRRHCREQAAAEAAETTNDDNE